MFIKVLNFFELFVLFAIMISIQAHYGYNKSGPFFYNGNLLIRVSLDIVLITTLCIRAADLIIHGNKKVNSCKKFYLPLVLYSMVIIPDLWQLYKVASFFQPILILSTLLGYSLPILILTIRIIITKKHIEETSYSEDILDF